MQLSEARFDSGVPVDGYGPGFFRVSGEVIEGPVLIGPLDRIAWAGLSDHAPLLDLAGQVDVLFLGTGAETAHPPKDLREACETAGLGLEAMASPAAARTYNVLLSEGRRVAVALMPV